MPVTTSDGKYYEDEYDHLHAQVFGEGYDPKTDTYQAPKDKLEQSQDKLDEPKKVHIVRHGETTENAANTVRGWEPVSLNDKGIEEAHKAAEDLKAKGVNAIVSSDLQRAKQTASIIGKELGIEPQFDPRLRTWNVGEYAGQPCEKANPELKVFAQHAQDAKPPGGESFNEFQDRSFSGIREAILNNKDKNLAIITHNRVEATLKGWEKTGQDNPDIDYNEVVKEETDPGTIRTMTMQPNSTIMQGRDTFDQRFQGHSDFGKPNSDTFFQRFEGFPWKMPIAEAPTEYTSPSYLKGVDQWPAPPNSFNITSKDFRQPNFNPDNPMNKNLYQPINDDPIRRKMEGIFGKIPGEAGGGGGGSGTSRSAAEDIKARLEQLKQIEQSLDVTKTRPGYWNEGGKGYEERRAAGVRPQRPYGYWSEGGEGYRALREHFEQGGSVSDFARQEGITPGQVSNMRKRYGLERLSFGTPVKDLDVGKIEALRNRGMTWDDIAKEIGSGGKKPGASLLQRYQRYQSEAPDWFKEEMNQ